MTATTQHPYGDHDDQDGRDGVIPFPGTAWQTYDPDDDRHDDHDDPGQDDDQDQGGDRDRDDEVDRDGGVLVVRDRGGIVPAADRDDPDRDQGRDDADRDGDRDDEGGDVQTGELVFVDPDPAKIRGAVLPWQRDDSRPPVIPEWLRDAHTRRKAVEWAIGAARHVTAFHAARIPVYSARLLVRSPRGGFRLARDWGRWVLDVESRPLVLAAIKAEDAELHLKLTEKRVNRMRSRGVLSVLGVVAITGMTAFGIATQIVPVPVLLLIAAVVIGLLGLKGSNQDRPVIERALSEGKIPQLTSDLLITALGSLGLARLDRALRPGGRGIEFPDAIARDGAGWRAVIDLPYGVTANDVIERKEALASGLRRSRGCVWPEGDSDVHEGRLIVWVGDTDFAKAKQPEWALAKTGQFDIFDKLPFGTDQRGRIVAFCLMFTSMLLGAIPRMGKTFALRLLLLACALDPTVILYVYDLKGLGDLKPLCPVAHRYACGPADDATVALVIEGLRELSKEIDRRTEVMSRLPEDLLPENQLTSEVAKNLKLGLQPIVCGIDEVHGLFKSKYAAEAQELCERILKLGPAMGIMLILATQRPDKDSIPTSLSALVGVRCAMRVKGHQENDMILGTSAHQNGLRATAFTRNDKGIGILDGHDDDHQVVRTFYIDGPAASAIAERARALREAAGTITGYAAGETAEVAPVYSLLDDLAAVWPAGEEKVWSERLCEGLIGLRPDHYRDIDPAALNARLKPYGVAIRQVWGKAAPGENPNKRGVHRTDLDKARRALQRDQATGQDGAAG